MKKVKHLSNVIFKIHALAKGLFFGLMVTTAWMAYRVAESMIGGSLQIPQLAESLLIVGVAMIATYMIDNALYQHAVNSLASVIDQGGIFKMFKAGGFYVLVMLSLMVFRFFFSGSATYLTGESTVIERQTTDNNIKLVESLKSKKDNALAEIRNTRRSDATQVLSTAQAEAADIKATAERLARKKIETAIAQGSTTEQEAYKRGDWIRRSYSISIKKAKKEAYEMEEAAAKKAEALLTSARQRHKSILSNMQQDIYKEENSSKWQALETEVQRNIKAQNLLWAAERWTYYLLDFIFVFGGFCCSWLVAYYIVKTDTDVAVFFPEKPGVIDVAMDMVDSMYAYIVTVLAQIPAYFKAEGSKKMVKVAKSVGSSSASYNEAIAQYIVASHPEVSAQFGAAAHYNAMQKAQAAAAKKVNHSTVETVEQQAKRNSETTAKQQRNTIELELTQRSNDAGATSETATKHQQRNREVVTKSGGAFRSYLSRAGRAEAAGDEAKALELLDKAEAAIPDDHLQAGRMQKIKELRNLIENE